MKKVYEVINQEITKFNQAYDQDSATESQKAYTKQFEGLDHINTCKVSAKASWDFSNLIASILEAVEKAVKETPFEEVPENHIAKGTPEYKALKKEGQKPLKAITGFREDLRFSDLRNLPHSLDVTNALFKKTFYFNK